MKIALAITFAIIISPTYIYADVCEDMDLVIQSMQNDFDDWKGDYDSDTEEYSATHLLPNAEECFVDSSFSSYSCYWHLESQQEASSERANLAKEIASCQNLFNEQPRTRDFQHPSRDSSYSKTTNSKSTVIYADDIGAEIRVSSKTFTKKRRGETLYLLSIDVEKSTD